MGWPPHHRSAADPEPGQAEAAGTRRSPDPPRNPRKVPRPAQTRGLGQTHQIATKRKYHAFGNIVKNTPQNGTHTAFKCAINHVLTPVLSCHWDTVSVDSNQAREFRNSLSYPCQ